MGLKRYDGHFLIKERSEFNIEVSTMPSNLENYVDKRITFSVSSQLINARLRTLINKSKSKVLTSECSNENIQLMVK